MIPKNTKNLLNEFRSSRGQFEEAPKQEAPRKKRKKGAKTHYDVFLKKYEDLENRIDDFNVRDLVFYFREIAKEHGYKYAISNITKEMAVMKRLTENYDNREICAMIEFLYDSEQDYLPKDRLSPSLLSSGWVNTIYADMKLWVEDKYVPNSKKSDKPKHVSKGEWNPNTDTDEEDIEIGIRLKR